MFLLIILMNNCQNIQKLNNIRINYSIQTCIIIENCIFKNLIEQNQPGGAIFLNDEFKICLINNCIFHECKSIESTGGALYLILLNSSIIKTCGSYCYASSSQFGFIRTFNYSIINYTSIYKCPSIYSTVTHNFQLDRGFQICKLINSSFNKLSGHSPSIQFNGPHDLNANYLTLINCTGQFILILNGGNGNNEINYSNIINNNPIHSLIYCYKNYTFNFNNLFNNLNNFIFYPSIGNLILNNCNTLPISTYFFKNYYQNNCSLILIESKLKLKKLNYFLIFLHFLH